MHIQCVRLYTNLDVLPIYSAWAIELAKLLKAAQAAEGGLDAIPDHLRHGLWVLFDFVYYLCTRLDAQEVASAEVPRDQLKKIMEAERKQKAVWNKHRPTRHGNFGTSVQVREFLGDRTLALEKENQKKVGIFNFTLKIHSGSISTPTSKPAAVSTISTSVH